MKSVNEILGEMQSINDNPTVWARNEIRKKDHAEEKEHRSNMPSGVASSGDFPEEDSPMPVDTKEERDKILDSLFEKTEKREPARFGTPLYYLQNSIWKAKDGRQTHVTEMERGHLLNTIKFIELSLGDGFNPCNGFGKEWLVILKQESDKRDEEFKESESAVSGVGKRMKVTYE